MPAVPAGTRFGPYEILDSLGAGGMGEVYRARDSRLNRTVAIKVLPPSLAGDAERRLRFEREARTVAMLEHPHVCGIYDFGDLDGSPYLVMPLLDGETLAARLEKGALPLDLALRVAIDIADALQAAHRVGVVHRDLKPANVFLVRRSGSATPDARLLDFGLAKLRSSSGALKMSTGDDHATTHATAQGTILGTVPYMSPEQVEGRETDHRTDLWSLGVLIYEMVSGTLPFNGQSAVSILGSILKDSPPVLSSRQPLAPAALDQLVTTCLAKDPEERWQSASDVKRQLEWIARATATAASASGGTSAAAVPGPKARSALAVAVPVALAALLVGALGSWFAFSPSSAATANESDHPIVFEVDPPAGMSLGGPTASTSAPQLALSPDGRRLVFIVEEPDGQLHLWLRNLDDQRARRLPGTEGGADPFWSADSQRIAFVAQGELKTIGFDDPSPQNIAPTLVDSRGGAWHSDGTIVFYRGGVDGLWRIPPGGGPGAQHVIANGVGMTRWPEFLPGTHAFTFQIRNASLEKRGIYLASLDNSNYRRLIGSDWQGHYGSGYMLFLDNGTLLAQPFDVRAMALSGRPRPVAHDVGRSTNGYGAFSVSTNGVLAYAGSLATESEVRWISRTGATLDTALPAADYVDFTLSPDGTRLAYSRGDRDTQSPDIWVRDLTRQTDERITGERLVDASPLWSPDGTRLVFRSNRASSTNTQDLFLTAASPGAEQRRVLIGAETTSPPTLIFPTYWSPDGHIVFFQVSPSTGWGIWSFDLDKQNPQPIVDTKANELQPAISPNAKWMAYASDQTGHYEVYLQDFPSGDQRTVISTNGGVQPRWRADGRELYYLQADGTLMAVTLPAADRFEFSKPTALFKGTAPTLFNLYRIDYVPSADGQRFLMRVPVAKSAPSITVALNWPALLH